MAGFKDLLGASEEQLVNLFYKLQIDDRVDLKKKHARIAKKLKLNPTQFICALGFNRRVREVTEILSLLGFYSFEALANQRNEFFINDIYKQLSLDNVLSIYSEIKNDADSVQIMQYLLVSRLHNVESRIEQTVNSLTIEKYKAEMRAIYADGIALIDLAEDRLSPANSGFRALLNEVSVIVDSKLIPVGDIFFRDSILPEEKRKLLMRGLIPRNLILNRLEDQTISRQERLMLEEYLRQTKKEQPGPEH
ncbi:MAG: hypothetical protein L0Z68_03495 [Gammaproteobacteria bacterium]|nr:hypothetical protein [Gammaproteobacteria bacterium]